MLYGDRHRRIILDYKLPLQSPVMLGLGIGLKAKIFVLALYLMASAYETK